MKKKNRKFYQNDIVTLRYDGIVEVNKMDYEETVKQSLNWIESNLHYNIRLEDVAAATNFSKFHFHRIFQRVVKMSVDDYVRMRRLAVAATMLIHSNERIINIAFDALFHSQEAFSRAFKKMYHLSPGEYRKVMRLITFEKERERKMERLKGWLLSGSHPQNYEMGVDDKIVHEGRKSGFLQSKTVMQDDEFATMMQQFKADIYKGKRMRLSCFVKSKEVKQFAGVWMRVDNSIGDVLQFDNMSDRPITGTNDWNYYSIVLDIPDNSSIISFGILIQGHGKLWVDGFSFAEVDLTTKTTNIDVTPELLDEPINLSFED